MRIRSHYGAGRVPASMLERMSEALVAPVAPDERFFHEDLPQVSDGTLRLERHRLRMAILLSQRPSWWVVERLERVEAELESRRGR